MLLYTERSCAPCRRDPAEAGAELRLTFRAALRDAALKGVRSAHTPLIATKLQILPRKQHTAASNPSSMRGLAPLCPGAVS